MHTVTVTVPPTTSPEWRKELGTPLHFVPQSALGGTRDKSHSGRRCALGMCSWKYRTPTSKVQNSITGALMAYRNSTQLHSLTCHQTWEGRWGKSGEVERNDWTPPDSSTSVYQPGAADSPAFAQLWSTARGRSAAQTRDPEESQFVIKYGKTSSAPFYMQGWLSC